MLQRRLLPYLSVLLCCVPTQGGAQSAPSDRDTTIVVTGHKQDPRKTAQAFVNQVLDPRDGQLARFRDPVCVQVIGLPPKIAAAVQGRVVDVAHAVGVPSAKANCEPNMMLMFVANSDNFMTVMRKQHSAFFNNLADGDRHDAFRPGSIRSWRQLAVRDDVGNIGLVNDSSDATPSYETPTETISVNAVLVIDRKSAAGRSIKQLADYAAMRMLTGARPPEKGGLAATSILSLFDPASTPAPSELTDWDLSLLAALYHMPDTSTTEDGQFQAGNVSRHMVAIKDHTTGK